MLKSRQSGIGCLLLAIVLIAVLLFTPVLPVCGLFLMFFNGSSPPPPPDIKAFMINRLHLPDDIPESELIPYSVGQFILVEPAEWQATDSEKYVSAVYRTNDGRETRLYARWGTYRDDWLTERLSCGDCMGSTPEVRSNAAIPHSVAFCGCMGGYGEYQIRWLNGRWRIAVSAATTSKMDGQMLLQFVNDYPH